MIVSYISGRLGNQLFEYAYVRSLLEQRGGKKVLYLILILLRKLGLNVMAFVIV